MKRKTLVALAATAGLILPMTGVTSAFAADADACTITGEVTGGDLTDKMKTCTEKIKFEGDVTVKGQTIVSSENGMTFETAVGSKITFDGDGGTESIFVVKKGNFTFNNQGIVTFQNALARGLVMGNTEGPIDVVLKGTSADGQDNVPGAAEGQAFKTQYVFRNIVGYNIDAQEASSSGGGTFTIKDTTVDISTPETGTEGPMIFGTSIKKVDFDHARIIVDKNGNTITAFGQAAIGITAADTIIHNGTYLESSTNTFYNLSVYGAGHNLDIVGTGYDPCKENASTVVKLISKPQAGAVADASAAHESSGGKAHAVVGVNTANNTVVIRDGALLEVQDNSRSELKAGLEFQDATYSVENATVKTGTIGVDDDAKAESKLNIVGTASKVIVEKDVPSAGDIFYDISDGRVQLPGLDKALIKGEEVSGKEQVKVALDALGKAVDDSCKPTEDPEKPDTSEPEKPDTSEPEKPDTSEPEKPETEAPAKPAEKDQPAKQKPAMKQAVAKKPALAATGSSALALGLASFGLVLLGGVMMATRRRSTTA